VLSKAPVFLRQLLGTDSKETLSRLLFEIQRKFNSAFLYYSLNLSLIKSLCRLEDTSDKTHINVITDRCLTSYHLFFKYEIFVYGNQVTNIQASFIVFLFIFSEKIKNYKIFLG
jgi:hypothetical protein